MKKTAVGFVFMLLITAVFSVIAVYAIDNSWETGLPYDGIVFGKVESNPFATASKFNLFVLEDCENLQEAEGAIAVGGTLINRGNLSVGMGVSMSENPKNTRLIVGGNTVVNGYLNTFGNVVSGASFSTKPNSTYELPALEEEVLREIDELYSIKEIPWEPTIVDSVTQIISQENSVSINSGAVGAKLHVFFEDAKKTLTDAQEKLLGMETTGSINAQDTRYVFEGDESVNVFKIDLQGKSLDAELVFNTPESSVNIVNVVGTNKITAHHETGGSEVILNVVGEELEFSGNVAASILAPNTDFYAMDGGSISGNLVVANYHCDDDSKFTLMYTPFESRITSFYFS